MTGCIQTCEFFHQFFDHTEGGRAICYVLTVPDHVIGHLSSGEMRKTGAVSRPYLIDTAHIRSGIQELAGLCSIHPITIAVEIQPPFPKGIRCHIQMLCNPSYILLREGGGHLPAAIGA